MASKGVIGDAKKAGAAVPSDRSGRVHGPGTTAAPKKQASTKQSEAKSP
jgi:hypothetical protein